MPRNKRLSGHPGLPSNPVKVVLFDLDGTLVKAGGSGRKALDRAAMTLYGVHDVCSLFSLAGRTDKQNFRLAHLKATGRKPLPRHLTRLEKAYLERLPREVRKAVASGTYQEIFGISKLLRALAARRNVMLGLGTGNILKGARIKLKPSGFLRYFAFGGYGSDGYSRVRMLKKAVRRAGVLYGGPIRPEDVYVIGDTPRDVRAGKKAGYRTGAVTSGYGSVEEIKKANPDLVTRDFKKTGPWLRWILSGGRR